MFDNIGRKVIILAIVEMIIGIIGSLIGAVVLWVNDEFLAGLLVLIVGCLIAWVGSWITYAIGETNETVNALYSMLQQQRSKPFALSQSDRKKILESGGWECPCGNVNHSYVSTCSCGRNKRDVLAARQQVVPKGPAQSWVPSVSASDRQTILDSGGWECPCGNVNHSYVSTCSCGRNKREVLAARNKEKSN